MVIGPYLFPPWLVTQVVSVVVAGLRPGVPGTVHQPAHPARAGWLPGTVCAEGTVLLEWVMFCENTTGIAS